MKCTAGKSGYTDISSSTNNVATLKCIAGCPYPDSYDNAKIVTAANDADFQPGRYKGLRYLKPEGSLVTTCKPLQDGFYWTTNADINLYRDTNDPNFKYVCKVIVKVR